MKFSRYYTSERVEVTNRIEKGLTFAYCSSELNKAREKAEKLRSYVYELYEEIRGKLVFCGYAVPK